MANPRIEGAIEEFEGKAKRGAGRLVGDSKFQVDGAVKEVSGRAKNAYGRVIDGLDDMVDRAPSDVREPARRALGFAREKPLLTVGIIAGAAALLGAMGRKR